MAALNGHAQNYHQTDVFATGLDSPLVDALNVRYIVVPSSTPPDQLAPRFARAVQTVYADAHVRVLENLAALPRAWLVHRAEQLPPRQVVAALAAGAVDLRRVALIEEPPPVLAATDDTSLDQVSITADAPDHILARTTSGAAGLVVLSETYYPAWHAYVDGQAAPIYVADHALRAVAVPAGEHRLEMRYESAALSIGLVISVLALVALLALAVDRARAAFILTQTTP
ncbi:MAG: YfhO family protein [Chloroflexi bacterium]|nr:YfhO family protein [Chloroflexota bacterium]